MSVELLVATLFFSMPTYLNLRGKKRPVLVVVDLFVVSLPFYLQVVGTCIYSV